MLKTSTYSRFKRFFCLVLALHFLNCSIDPKDPHSNAIPEDLTLNDIETVTEFFAEVVFGWSDAFAEHDEKDNDDGSTLDFHKFFFSKSNYISISFSEPDSRKAFMVYDDSKASSLLIEIIAPPPEL
jgi:hypothetical protein